MMFIQLTKTVAPEAQDPTVLINCDHITSISEDTRGYGVVDYDCGAGRSSITVKESIAQIEYMLQGVIVALGEEED